MIPLARTCVRISLLLIAVCLMAACSSTKHVPQGQYLLDKATISVEGDKDVTSLSLINYLRQIPNHRVLLGWKLQLGTYNLSGKDSTKWYNKWLRRLGQPPAIYDQSLTDASVKQLAQTMVNRGYLDVNVRADTVIHGRKINVNYHVETGEPHKINSFDYNLPDSAIEEIVLSGRYETEPKVGDKLDRDRLEALRVSLVERLRNHGYYDIGKEAFSFVADTAENSKEVNLELNLNAPKSAYEQKVSRIGRVMFVTDYSDPDNIFKNVRDSVHYDGMTFLYSDDRYIKARILAEKCYLVPGKLYSARNVTRTYENLAQLGILKSVNIDFAREEPKSKSDTTVLNTYILLQRQKKQSVSFEVEGTNSEGDLGFGLGLTYHNRNLFHGSQLLSARLRMSYESLSGNLKGLINDHFTEYGAEVGLTFPRFIFPFISPGARRRLKVNTEVAVSFNYQQRPEYTRIIAGAAWKYKWFNREGTRRHNFDLLDISVVNLPKSTIDFLNEIAPDNPLLRYSYEDHFIMRMGYSYYFTNRRFSSTRLPGMTNYVPQPLIYTVRVNAETAGNLLYGLSWLTGAKKKDGAYEVFGIQYSQYVKAEGDYAVTRSTRDGRQAIAFHAGVGVGVPYGNSTALPFEKRFYGGGANGVRGWSVRTLGPGCFDGRNSVTDFINQCGDIRLILTAEARAKLFWVLEGAFFIDAGNIWTIKSYPNQPGGVFRFGNFYKELAASYGVGLRMDFDFFLVRLDMGIKAHNPAKGQEPWPLLHPRWKRDTAFHFAVGYPF